MRSALPSVILILAGVVPIGCGSGELSVSLVFPNEVARNAVHGLKIEVYRLSRGGDGFSNQTCEDFLGRAALGLSPQGTPVRSEFTCDDDSQDCSQGWFGEREVIDIPDGRSIIYVLAYSSSDRNAPAFLEGCSDRFDTKGGAEATENVPIELSAVLPSGARLVKRAGDLQVARAGQELPVPLTVLVETTSPWPGGGSRYYPIPGVAVRFETETAGLVILDDPGATRFDGVTDINGELEVQVRLPDGIVSDATVEARTASLVDVNPDASEVVFQLSAVSPPRFPQSRVFSLDGVGRGVAVELGQFDTQSDVDAVVLSCNGSTEGCALGAEAQPPYGATVLTMIGNIGSSSPERREIAHPATGAGILPNDLAVINIDNAGRDEVAVLNAKRAGCQNRTCSEGAPCPCFGAAPGEPCPCEGSEIVVYRSNETTLEPYASPYTMTASNAVNLVPFLVVGSRAQVDGTYWALAAPAQGRSVHTRTCSMFPRCAPADLSSNICMDLANCGCPPEEKCDGTGDTGVCRSTDQFVDLLAPRFESFPVRPNTPLYNRGGCQKPMLSCDNDDASGSTCHCDDGLGNACSETDGCGCRVPNRIHIGGSDSIVRPLAMSAGRFSANAETSHDFVVGTASGLRLIRAEQETRFELQGEPFVNSGVGGVFAVNIDSVTEEEKQVLNRVDDVVWFAEEACGAIGEETCLYVADSIPEADRRGCFGVYFSAGESSLFDVQSPNTGGCRRHHLDFVPSGMCVADFNGDQRLDVALSGLDITDVVVFSGNGRAGFQDPPERFPLPRGGGRMACEDLDGDGRDDIVVVDVTNSAVQVLSTGS